MKVSAPKINKKAIAKLNDALLLASINSDCGLSVRDDNTYTLHMASARVDVPTRVVLCGDYILNSSVSDISDAITDRYWTLNRLRIHLDIEEVYSPLS